LETGRAQKYFSTTALYRRRMYRSGPLFQKDVAEGRWESMCSAGAARVNPNVQKQMNSQGLEYYSYTPKMTMKSIIAE
jgi:hypothetical protein